MTVMTTISIILLFVSISSKLIRHRMNQYAKPYFKNLFIVALVMLVISISPAAKLTFLPLIAYGIWGLHYLEQFIVDEN